MTKQELAKSILSNINGRFFRCHLSAVDEKEEETWDDYEDIYLSSRQILYLLKERLNKEDLFEDIETEKIDVFWKIRDIAHEKSIPEIGPWISANDVIPYELYDIDARLKNLDENDIDEVKSILKELLTIEEDYYTFSFGVSNDLSRYALASNYEGSIYLTAREAIGLLYGKYGYKKVFEGICDEALTIEFVNSKAMDEGLNEREEFDILGYGGDSDELNGFLDTIEYIINNILTGKITARTLNDITEILLH